MMHPTKKIKRCLTQPRLLLRPFLLGLLLTGCFAVMADLGVAMASAQSLAGQNGRPNHSHFKPNNKQEQETPEAAGSPVASPAVSPTAEGTHIPTTNNNTTGSGTTAAGSNNSSGIVPVGGVPGIGGIPVGGVSRPGLPAAGSDPGNNLLP